MHPKGLLMKKLLIFMLIAALLAPCALGEVFVLPRGISDIGSEAFAGIVFADGVAVPQSVSSIATDAFGNEPPVVYGFSGSSAEEFCRVSGADFIPADFTDVTYDVPAYVSPYTEFEVSFSCVCALDCTVKVEIVKDGRVHFTGSSLPGEKLSVTLYEGGLYDYRVTFQNACGSKVSLFEGETEVYSPILLTRDCFECAVGSRFIAVDEAETREVTLSCEDSGLSIEGSTVTALRLGSYTVTASAEENGETVTTVFSVFVRVPAESIRLNTESLTLGSGETAQLLFSVTPSEAADNPVSWASADESVAVVDENGLVTGIGGGSTVITARVFDCECSCAVSVSVPCTSVVINSAFDGNTLMTGEKAMLSYTAYPVTTDSYRVTWRSTDASVLSVDSKTGRVCALKPGAAMVYAECEDNPAIFDVITLRVVQGVNEITHDIPDMLYVGDVISPSWQVLPADAVDTSVVFVSSNPSVLSVDESGALTALSSGNARITATAVNGLSCSKDVKVSVRCESITCRLNSLYVNLGMNVRLPEILDFEPFGCYTGNVTYTSSNPSVVKVDSRGVLTGIATGYASITVSAGSAKCTVIVSTVSGSLAPKITVSDSYVTLKTGDTYTLNAQFANSTPYTELTWYTDSSDCLELKQLSTLSYKIKALKAGMVNVYVLAASGEVTCIPVAISPVYPRSLQLSASELTLDIGDTSFLSVTSNPLYADLNEISVYSDDERVAVVTADGMVTAVGGGSCTLHFECPNCSAECRVTVRRPLTQNVYPEFTEYSANAGDCFDILYSCSPEGSLPDFEWTSSNSAVADVDESGSVLCISGGKAVITGIARDGSGLQVEISVSVAEIPVKSFELAGSEIILPAGEHYSLDWFVYPLNASWAAPAFSSLDESVAIVDEFGVITGVGNGTTMITATVGSGTYVHTDTFTVTVEGGSETVYRALIMGQFSINGTENFLPFSENCTSGVNSCLSSSLIDGKPYSVQYMGSSPEYSTFKGALSTLASRADEDDVTVIYILTHGNYNAEKKRYEMGSHRPGDVLYDSELLSYVTRISGHVVLCLCTCHSGEIFLNGTLQGIMNNGGTYEGQNGTGHLSVITASTDTRSCYYDVADTSASYDFFSKAFNRALGWDMISDTSCRADADKDGSGRISVKDLFESSRKNARYFISAYLDKYGKTNFNGNEKQLPKYFIADGDEELTIFAAQKGK